MEKFISQNLWIIYLVVLWTLPWKGIALWKSAQKRDLVWFVILLIFNTLAILEILYIFIFSKKLKEKSEVSS
jgi:methionyl-tRNA synthetase